METSLSRGIFTNQCLGAGEYSSFTALFSLSVRGLLVGSYLRLCQHLFGVPEKRRRKVVSIQSRLRVYVKPPTITVVWREEQIRHSRHPGPVSGFDWTAKLCF
jgi:hypothetical protein